MDELMIETPKAKNIQKISSIDFDAYGIVE